MKMKKFLAGVCTGALALSLSAPAFAGNISNPNQTTFNGNATISGTVSVKVLAGSTNLYINPYGVAYKLDNGEVFTTVGATTFDKTKDFAIAEAETSAGFFSDTVAIQNNSSKDLKVGVSMTTTEKTGSAVKFVAAAPGSAPADNTMWGNFEITSATVETGTAKVTKTVGQDKVEETGVNIITPDWTASKTIAIPAGSGTAGTAGNPSAVTDTTFVLPKAEVTEGMGGSTTTPGYAAYRLTGSVAIGTTNNVWPVADLADVDVAFTFLPEDQDFPAAVTVRQTGTVTAGTAGTVTLDATVANLPAGVTPTYSWAVKTDTNSIVDASFSDSAAATQTVPITGGASTSQSAVMTVTVTYTPTGGSQQTVTADVTITVQ